MKVKKKCKNCDFDELTCFISPSTMHWHCDSGTQSVPLKTVEEGQAHLDTHSSVQLVSDSAGQLPSHSDLQL